ncbi:MAG TPA: tRNA (adenosine(37)-N6)-dimethylallyltransferase MiaA, partial [candidate division Zixibacteria bacterium]|nr:tRNA (adenosine(37)-N6)-dimethylallyltransferase MiaA [candidate division Zixibacteria bacterium]
VYIVSGKPISYWWKTATKKPSEWKFVKIILNKERKALYERIEKRVDEMLEAGWVDEVKNLLKSGVTENAPAFSSIGYRQVVDYIKGKLSWEQMREQIIKATKEYARRQLIWFRKEPGAVWLDTTGKNSQEVALEVIKIWRETEKNA